MAEFHFALKDFSDPPGAARGLSRAKAFNDYTINRDPDGGTKKPLKTTAAIDPAPPQQGITTFNMSQIMQGSAINKPAVAPYDAYNQFLSGSLSSLLGTAQGNAATSLGNQKTIVPEDILQQAGILGAKNASTGASQTGAGGSPSSNATDMFSKAQAWVDAHVPYNQGATKDGYRTDCSGFVSMCWGLSPPGQNTEGLLNFAHLITRDELQPGDILLNHVEHVVLFQKWSDDAHTKYMGYEQSGDGGAHNREIPYAYFSNPSTYLPYRKN